MIGKSYRAIALVMALSLTGGTQTASAQIRAIGNLQAQPSVDINTIQVSLNQLKAENQQLRADPAKLKKCFDEHRHWLAASGSEITTPTATGKAPGAVPLPAFCN